MNEEAAYHQAILQMGDAEQIGKLLNEQYKPKVDKQTIVYIVTCIVLSCIIYSMPCISGNRGITFVIKRIASELIRKYQ